jgi:hypothetical protein
MFVRLLAALILALVLGACKREDPSAAVEQEHNHDTQEVQGIVESPESLAGRADVPIYPGATLPEGKSNVRSDGQQTRFELVMESEDAALDVNAFYERESGFESRPDGDGFTLMGRTPKGHYAMVTVQREAEVTKIVAVSIASEELSSNDVN